MMMPQHKISSGYFPDFKGDPVVLFAGDRAALENLAAFLETLSTSREQAQKVLDEKQVFATKHKLPLKVEITTSPYGMRRKEAHFEWGISQDIARRFAELTRAVAASDTPCHQYLDSGETDEITVMVSKDEYDESLFALC
jgi:hypothetical protein